MGWIGERWLSGAARIAPGTSRLLAGFGGIGMVGRRVRGLVGGGAVIWNTAKKSTRLICAAMLSLLMACNSPVPAPPLVPPSEVGGEVIMENALDGRIVRVHRYCTRAELRVLKASYGLKRDFLPQEIGGVGPLGYTSHVLMEGAAADGSWAISTTYLGRDGALPCEYLVILNTGGIRPEIRTSTDFQKRVSDSETQVTREMADACEAAGNDASRMFWGGKNILTDDGHIATWDGAFSCTSVVDTGKMSIDVRFGSNLIRISAIWDRLFVFNEGI